MKLFKRRKRRPTQAQVERALALIEVAKAARSLADEYSGFLACTGRVLNVHADDQHLHVLVHALARFDFSEGDAA